MVRVPTRCQVPGTCWVKLGRMLPWPPLRSHGLQAAVQWDTPGNWRASFEAS